MWGRPKLAALIATALALFVPSAAQGAVTIGSNLGRAPEGAPSSYGCAPSCTLTQTTLAADRVAPGGLVSPVNGTVVLWRIRVAGGSTPTALRVIKSLGDEQFTGAGRSSTVTPATNALSSFPTQLPITIGESIGIDCCSPSAQYFLNGGGSVSTWNPSLAEGGPGMGSTVVNTPKEMTVNADIEPTATLGSVKAKPRKGGKIKVTLVAPNPGTLFATGKGLHSSPRKQVPAAGPFTLIVKPYFLTKRKLADGKRVKAKLKLTFTPTGGSAAVQALKVRLKR
jgi:hypothetical protein